LFEKGIGLFLFYPTGAYFGMQLRAPRGLCFDQTPAPFSSFSLERIIQRFIKPKQAQFAFGDTHTFYFTCSSISIQSLEIILKTKFSISAFQRKLLGNIFGAKLLNYNSNPMISRISESTAQQIRKCARLHNKSGIQWSIAF
jgi:hypothetical protein